MTAKADPSVSTSTPTARRIRQPVRRRSRPRAPAPAGRRPGLRRHRRHGADDGFGIGQDPAAQLDQVPRHPVRRGVGRCRVDATFESPGGLGGHLCRRVARAIVIGVEVRRLDHDRVVAGSHSVVAPPITPASPIGPESSMISRSSPASFRTTSSRVSLLPRRRLPHPDRPGQLVAVIGVDRLTDLEHHVVGDVDGERDRPHPGHLHPLLHPAREAAVSSTPVTVRATNSEQAGSSSSTG